MRMWWQGMVMVLGEAILRAVAGAEGMLEKVDLEAGAGAAAKEDLGAGGAAEKCDLGAEGAAEKWDLGAGADEELLTRTTRSTGAPEWEWWEGAAE
jgi:hypothetical protein